MSFFLNKIRLWLRNKIYCQPGNEINISGRVRVRRCKISLKGHGCSLTLHPDVNLRGVNIEIDGINCHINIGANTVVGENTYLSCRERDISLTIGDYCMFSRNVKVMTSDGHDIIRSGERMNYAKNITIGNKVWLADGVVFLKGGDIGDGCDIGINSVVTNKVQGNTVAVGCPAREVSKNVSWRKELTY